MQKIGTYNLNEFKGSDPFSRSGINENTKHISAYMDKQDAYNRAEHVRVENQAQYIEDETNRRLSGAANLHVWRALADVSGEVPVKGEAETISLLEAETISAPNAERPLPEKVKVWYADNVNINAGEITLADPVSSIDVDFSNPAAAAEMLYCRCFIIDGDSKVYVGVDKTADIAVTSVETDDVMTHTWRVLYTARLLTIGTNSVSKDEYVVSEIEDAYSTSEYEYCGKIGGGLFYKTGTVTAENKAHDDGDYAGKPVQCKVGFKPIMWIFKSTQSSDTICAMFIDMTDSGYVSYDEATHTFTLDDRRVEAGHTYRWFALGYR